MPAEAAAPSPEPSLAHACGTHRVGPATSARAAASAGLPRALAPRPASLARQPPAGGAAQRGVARGTGARGSRCSRRHLSLPRQPASQPTPAAGSSARELFGALGKAHPRLP